VSVPVLYKSRLWDLGDLGAEDLVDLGAEDLVAGDLVAGAVPVPADLVAGAVPVQADLVAGVLGLVGVLDLEVLVGVLDLEVLVSGLDLVVASLEDSVMVYTA
jgi:hypothetical protein